MHVSRRGSTQNELRKLQRVMHRDSLTATLFLITLSLFILWGDKFWDSLVYLWYSYIDS